MKFFLKFIVVILFSTSIFATDLSSSTAPLPIEGDVVSRNDFIIPLTAISESLDILANVTAEMPTSELNVSENYKELHDEILKSISFFNEVVNNSSLVDEVDLNNPSLKDRVDILYQNQSYFSYADFAAIAITSVSVLITIIGIVIAVLSFWGYKNIKSTTEHNARTVAEKVAGETTEQRIDSIVKCKLEELVDEGKFTKHLEDVVDAFIFRNKTVNNSIDWDELDVDWDQLNQTIDGVEKENTKS